MVASPPQRITYPLLDVCPLPEGPQLPPPLQEAVRCWRRQDFDAMLSVVNQVLAQDPQQPHALHMMGLLAILLEKPRDGLGLLLAAANGAPQVAAFHNSVGYALLKLGEAAQARERFAAAVALDPALAEAHFNLANEDSLGGNVQAALEGLQRVLAHKPDFAMGHFLSAQVLLGIDQRARGNYHLALFHHLRPEFEREPIPPDDAYFLDRQVARREALARHTFTIPDTVAQGEQVCYHDGAPFPNAPDNLVSVPLEALTQRLAETRLRLPRRVVFDPTDPVQRERGHMAAVLLDGLMLVRSRIINAQVERLRGTPPEFAADRPLRVFLPTSRVTTVMQYATTGLAEGFRRCGCDVHTFIEGNAREELQKNHLFHDILAFQPHLLVSVNAEYCGQLPPEMFQVVWWQDPMPAILDQQPIPWRPRDLVLSISTDFDPHIRATGCREIMHQPLCIDDRVFRLMPGVERRDKVVFVGGSYRPNLCGHPLEQRFIGELTERFEAGLPFSREEVERRGRELGMEGSAAQHGVLNYVVRDLSVRWLCQQSGMAVEVYGRHWEADPLVAPFYRGELPHGEALARVYNEARYALVALPFEINTQRLVEVAACGAIPVVYDCRHRAEPPHWDDHCLFYRTREELHGCLGGQPPRDSREIAHGRSYEALAARLLERVREQLAAAG